MKNLNLASLVLVSFITCSAFSAVNGIKKFSGKLPTGKTCQVIYGPAIPNGPGVWKIDGFSVDLGDRKFELSGNALASSELNVGTNSLSGLGIIDRKVVITSEVLGVGYETGINVDFRAKLDTQVNPIEFTVSLQSYRNEYVFGSWVQGERAQVEVYNCR